MLRTALPKIVTESLPGPKGKALIERRELATPAAIKNVYPCVIARGEGAMIEDVDGNILMDWVGGVGVLNMGYSRPEVVEAVKAQAEKYFHGMFNIVTHEGYVALAEKLNDIAPVRGEKKKTFFANSGAESNENAVKLAKAFTKRPNIVVFSGAFHGRTSLTMAMTAKKAYAVGMGPFPDGVIRAPYPYLYRSEVEGTDDEKIEYYIDKLKQIFEENSPTDLAAVVLEPLQGEGGFIPAPIKWVKAVRELCDKYGILMIVDEVQSGFCRTGKMFASDYWAEIGAKPDILSTAKSIAAGVPISAIIASSEIVDAVPGGVIGGTYGGNALACASALQVIDIMEKENFTGKSQEIGKKCSERFNAWKETYEVIGDVRGLGAMIGIEFVKDKASKEPNPQIVSALVQECAQNGLIIENAGTFGNVIRFLAPLVITDEQLEAGFGIFEDAIKKLTSH